MKTVCDKNKCTGCMACVEICPKAAITVNIDLEACNANIDPDLCVACGLCYSKCQLNHPLQLQSPLTWKQGWSKDAEVRRTSASGGFATEIAKAFIKKGGVVYACVFEDGEFRYTKLQKKSELHKMAGSKYVKSDPSGVHGKIAQDLLDGRKVLFIGLPCHVAGLLSIIKQKENLFTIDLICHGTPSKNVLTYFLSQFGISLSHIKNISFRENTDYQITVEDAQGLHAITTKGVLDDYMVGYLSGVFYTETCYTCQYATIERVSDITLGDSWGSEFSPQEKKKGISLVLCQTKKGKQMLESAEVELFDVNLDNAKSHNQQLCAPATLNSSRGKFFTSVKRGRRFHRAIMKSCFIKSQKQNIKKILLRLKLYKR